MRTVAIEKLINLSIGRTKIILFNPFSAKKWLCLLFIAIIAGALGPGGNGSSSFNIPVDENSKSASIQPVRNDQQLILLTQYNNPNKPYREPPRHKSGHKRPPDNSLLTIFSAGFISFFVIILIVSVIILFLWLSARFKFVWADAIINNDASIKAPFSRYKREGNSLFKFYLLLTLSAILFIGSLGLWIYTSGKSAGIWSGNSNMPSLTSIFTTFIIPALIGITGIITLAILGFLVEHFIVPIMRADNSLFIPAWTNFMKIYNYNKKEFWFFLLVSIGVGIACGIIAFILILICLLAILLASALLLGIPYLIFGALLKMTPVFIIYAILAGIPFTAAAILILLSASLPFAVFFRSFSFYFLSSIECRYNPLPINEPVKD